MTLYSENSLKVVNEQLKVSYFTLKDLWVPGKMPIFAMSNKQKDIAI